MIIQNCIRSGEENQVHFNPHWSHIDEVSKTQQRCQYVPDFMMCITTEKDNLKNFWLNQKTGNLPALIDDNNQEILEVDFTAMNYNTLQLLSLDQFYVNFPREIQQLGEREVQLAESNPLIGDMEFSEYNMLACQVGPVLSIHIEDSLVPALCNKNSK